MFQYETLNKIRKHKELVRGGLGSQTGRGKNIKAALLTMAA